MAPTNNEDILTTKKPSCAYVCTDRELFRTFGIRTIRRVK